MAGIVGINNSSTAEQLPTNQIVNCTINEDSNVQNNSEIVNCTADLNMFGLSRNFLQRSLNIFGGIYLALLLLGIIYEDIIVGIRLTKASFSSSKWFCIMVS